MDEKGLEMNEQTSTPIGARSTDVEITRWYNDIDINRLLIEMSNNQEDYLVFDSITLDEAQITQGLTDAFDQINESRNIVIPVNLGQSGDGIYRGNHWTSLVIRHQDDGVNIYYQDSLGNPIPPLLLTKIDSVFPDAKIHDLRVPQQENGYDCGPLTILNLDALARTGKLPKNTDENAIIDQRTALRYLALNSPEQLYADDEETSLDEDDSEADGESDDEELLKQIEGEGLAPRLLKIVKKRFNELDKVYSKLEEQIGISELLEKELEKANENTEKGLSAASEYKNEVEEFDRVYESDTSTMSDTSMVSDTENNGFDTANELGDHYKLIISELIFNKNLKLQKSKTLKIDKSRLKTKEKLTMKGEISKLDGKIAKAHAKISKGALEKLKEIKAEIVKANFARDNAIKESEAEKERLQAVLEKAKAEIAQANLEKDIEIAKAEAQQQRLQTELDKQIAEANSQRDNAIAKAEAEKQRLQIELDKQIAEANSERDNAIAEAKDSKLLKTEALEKANSKIANAEAEKQKLQEALDKKIAEAIYAKDVAIAEIETEKQRLKETLDKEITEANSARDNAIAEVEAQKQELQKALETEVARIAEANSIRDAKIKEVETEKERLEEALYEAETQIAEAQKQAQEQSEIAKRVREEADAKEAEATVEKQRLQEELDQANAAIIETQRLAQEAAARVREEADAKAVKAQKEFQEQLNKVMAELAEAHSTKDVAIAKAATKTGKQKDKDKVHKAQDSDTYIPGEVLGYYQTDSLNSLGKVLLDHDSQSDNQPKALVGKSHDQNDEVQDCTCVIL
jgi:hypothetical protein